MIYFLLAPPAIWIANIFIAACILGYLDGIPRAAPIVQWYRDCPEPLKGFGFAMQFWPLALWWMWATRRSA